MDEARLEFFRSLSNYELAELALAYNTAGLEQLTVFVTALFAYIFAAYFVGSKLNKFQVLSISLVYSLFEAFNVYGYFAIASGIAHSVYVYRGIDVSIVAYGPGFVCVASWILSIIFMVDARKRKNT